MKTKLILCLCLLLAAGCGQVVLKDPNGVERLKANVFMWDFKFDEIVYKNLQIERFDGKANEIEAYTPYGVIKTKGQSE